MDNSIQGVGVALVTPFTTSGDPDLNALSKLLEHTARGGVDYYVVHGTTGESVTTTAAEKLALTEHILEHRPKPLPLVYGLGGSNTQTIRNKFKKLSWEGIDAILSVSPSYSLPTQEGLFQHFWQLAEEAPRPLILYNVPARTARNLTAETCLRLAEHPNVLGIKEASKDLNQATEIARHKPAGFQLISGDDMLTLPLISVGASGVISVMANALPQLFSEMVHRALKDEWQPAREKLFRLLDINSLLYEEGNPAGIKQLLCELGICAAGVRLPLVAASSSLRQRLQQAVGKLEL